MRRLLGQPYPGSGNRKTLGQALIVGLFVGLFLIVFRPFGLSELRMVNHQLVILGYGGVTLVIFAGLELLMPWLFPSWYAEERWTVGRQILQTLLVVSMIGFGNLAYTALLPGHFVLNLWTVLYFQGITLAVAVFPVTVMTLVNELRLARRNAREANKMTGSFRDGRQVNRRTVALEGENLDESLELPADQLLYIESADNYAIVYFLQGRQTARKALRSSLKRLETQLSGSPLVRCHRAFIANLDKVVSVSGNAQGYRLRLQGVDREIPVSRQYGRRIRVRPGQAATG